MANKLNKIAKRKQRKPVSMENLLGNNNNNRNIDSKSSCRDEAASQEESKEMINDDQARNTAINLVFANIKKDAKNLKKLDVS